MTHKMGKYRLIAVDMDGTLLMPDKSVHPDTKRDIEAVSAAGIEVVYCSGRSVAELLPYRKLLKTIRYAVCMSGALVYDFETGTAISKHGIGRELVRQIAAAAAEDDGMLHFLTEEDSIVRADQVTHMDDFHMGPYQPSYLETAKLSDDMILEAEKHEFVEKVNIYSRTPSAREKAYQALKHLPLTFAYAESTSLEMNAAGVTKAQGLITLAEYLGIPIEQTVGIGDAENDRAMLETVGYAVAMGNAEAAIKALCDAVTEDNEHNGAGKAAVRAAAIES